MIRVVDYMTSQFTRLWRHRTDFQGYVSSSLSRDCRNSCSIDRLREIRCNTSDVGDCRQSLVRKFRDWNFATEKKNPRRDSNRGPLVNELLRSECSTTELAAPGSYLWLFNIEIISFGLVSCRDFTTLRIYYNYLAKKPRSKAKAIWG